MKRLLLAYAVIALCAISAFASPTVELTVYQPGLGIVELTPNNAEGIGILGPSTFQTYCIERNEHAKQGETYLFDVSSEALAGGITLKSNGFGPDGPGTLGGDPIDPWSAYLYTGVREGWLSGYDPLAGDDFAVQNAIWFIEGEQTSLYPRAQYFYDLAKAEGWQDTGRVVVLNLWGFTTSGEPTLEYKQDVLAIIPAPGAILLGGIGVSIVGWMRRRKTL